MLKTLFLGLALSSPLAATDLDYKDGATALKGYLAQPDSASEKRPGVLIIHQWLGLTDYEKGRADQVAKELGYVALAADIYGPDAPKDKAGAGAAAGKYKGDRKLYRQRLEAGVKALKAQKGVDPKRIVVMGYCFGGTGALEAARAGLPVQGVVSFHGGLDNKLAGVSKIRPKVLVLHGAADPHVKPEEVAAFEAEMDQAKADWQLVKYSGAVHAFTQPGAGDDPSKGAAYHASADRRSWQALKSFLAELFGR